MAETFIKETKKKRKKKKKEKEESLIDLSLLKKEPIRRVGMGLGSGS